MSNSVSWFLFFSKEERLLALPSWAAPRVLIVSRSAGQRWKDSAAFYPALRVRAKVVKLGIRMLAACLPGLFARQTSSSGVVNRNHRVATFLYRRFPSFKQSAIAYSLFPAFFVEKGVIDANAFGDCPGEHGGLTDVVNRSFEEYDRVVLIAGAAADPKQKLVAKVLDRTGRDLGYLKFGEKPLARKRIENEARILQALPDGAGPAFGGFEQTDKLSWFAMSAVDGQMLEATLPASADSCQLAVVKGFLDQLQVSDQIFAIDEHPAIQRIQQQVLGVKQDIQIPSDLKLRTLDFDNLLAPLRERAWPVVIQHGDFVPWNLIRLKANDGARCEKNSQDLSVRLTEDLNPKDLNPKTSASQGLCAIDWEEGNLEGFPCFDLIYFVIQTAFFMHHWDAGKTFEYAMKAVGTGRWAWDGECLSTKAIHSLIRLAALDAWLSGERGGLSGNALQAFRMSIVNLALST